MIKKSIRETQLIFLRAQTEFKTKTGSRLPDSAYDAQYQFHPQRKNGFGLSGGISAGYLYSARYKTKEGKDVEKVKSDFDLERFQIILYR